MAKKKPAVNQRYLIINLGAFINSYPLQTLTFAPGSELQQSFKSLMYNSYGVHETHPNISMISLIAATTGAHWQLLPGEHQEVRPLI